MIQKLSVSNCRSFPDGFTFTLDDSDQYLYSEKYCNNKITAIFGNNGSGKSNFIKAIELVKNLICDKIEFKQLKNEMNKDAPLPKEFSFILEFDKNNIIFKYSATIDIFHNLLKKETFTVVDNKEYEIIKTKSDRIFLNIHDSKSVISSRLLSDHKKLLINNAQHLFNNDEIIKINKNIEERNDFALTFHYIHLLKTYVKEIVIIKPDTTISGSIDTDKTNKLLLSLDLGVKIEIVEDTDQELIEKIYSKFQNKIRNSSDIIFTLWSGGIFYNVHYHDKKLEVKHIEIELNSRRLVCKQGMLSAGTERIICLSSIITEPSSEQIFVVDEFDRKIHTVLTKKLIELFMEKKNSKQHLIFTTHEPDLLDLDFLNPDNIWIVDKSPGIGSYLYHCPDVDFENNIKKLYMEDALL